MIVMTKPKQTAVDKTKPNRSKPFGVQFYTDKATFDALTAYLANQPQHKRAKKRDVIESALHLLLAQEGFWPWPPADPDGKPKK